MKRRPTLSEAQKLLCLLSGEKMQKSSMTGPVFAELFNDQHFIRIGRGSYRVKSVEYLSKAIRQKWQINDLQEYIDFLQKENKDRTDVQNMLDGTKEVDTKTFQGFLVHSTDEVPYTLDGCQGTLPLNKGSFLFICDYEEFLIPDDVTVVYVENFTSFRQIDRYLYLFEPGRYVFVSRLLSSNALKEWLKMIPNRYIHFGDFDIYGIDIYLHFYDDLGERASFLIPTDIEERIRNHGNSELFYKQEKRLRNINVSDIRVNHILDVIKECRMGYEQEGYAESNVLTDIKTFEPVP